jgi:cytochrome c nitrite reductase small subunit
MSPRIMQVTRFLAPPPGWRPAVLVALGVFVGLGLYVVRISKAVSYLSDAPETCVNCHIMAPQYATWSHSSHREVAHCNDCHVPHDSLFSKMYFKAKDGLRHSTIFTLRKEPPVIRIHEAGAKVVQSNCIRCHEPLLTEDRVEAVTGHARTQRYERPCWECHRETPHGRVNSLASAPDARVPVPSSPVPDWLRRVVTRSSQPGR